MGEKEKEKEGKWNGGEGGRVMVEWRRRRGKNRESEMGGRRKGKEEQGSFNGGEGGRGMVDWRRRKGGLRWRVRKDVILNY